MGDNTSSPQAEAMPRALRIPLFTLLFVADVPSVARLADENLRVFATHYSPNEMQVIIDAVAWGVAHPGHDFKSEMNFKFNPSNKDLHAYLCGLQEDLARLPQVLARR